MFSMDIQGGREWVRAPKKKFGPSCNGGSAKRFYTIVVLMCQKKLTSPAWYKYETCHKSRKRLFLKTM
jgi:hypothetical protein